MQSIPLSTQDWIQGQRGLPWAAIIPQPPQAPAADCWTRQLWDLVIYPLDRHDLIDAFVRLARPLGASLSRVLREEKVRVVILPENQPTSSVVLPDGLRLAHEGDRGNVGSLDSAIGFYRSDMRLAMIREFHLGGTVIHELAHAIDDVLTGRCRLQQRVSRMLWERFPQGRQLVVGRHPDFSPVEYWAISLEIYYTLGGRRKIQAQDPELLKFLDYFLEPTA